MLHPLLVDLCFTELVRPIRGGDVEVGHDDFVAEVGGYHFEGLAFGPGGRWSGQYSNSRGREGEGEKVNVLGEEKEDADSRHEGRPYEYIYRPT